VRALSLVSCFVALLVAMPAGASEAVRFEYRAPAECPSEAVFVDRVRERSLHAELAADGELARTFVVTVAIEASVATARVDFVDADGSAVFRRVRGTTCEEAVSGIALVCALAIDGRATPEESEITAAPSLAAVPVVAPPAASPTTDAAEPRAPKAAPSRLPPTTAFSFGLGAGYASHAGPSGAPTVDAFVGGRLAEHGPSARVSAWHFWSDATTSSGREARFRGYGLRVEGCPIAFGSARFFAEPCLGVDGGVLLASAIESPDVPEPEDSAKSYFDLVAIARLGAEVSRFLLLEVQGELAVPLVRYSYGFGNPPIEPVYEIPAVGVSARGAVGFRFQ
jgi:hypothetical protein